MPISITGEWQQLALYAGGAALVLILLMNIPFVGRLIRLLLSFGLLALCALLLMQQAPYVPGLASLTQNLGLDDQQVVGDEVRIRMSPDGHFWADARVNGVRRRMLIDSGATVTAISSRLANDAKMERTPNLVPVVLRTANGTTTADTGSIDRLQVGSIEARNLKVLTSPAMGDVNVLGMNFLSQLQSWRVEGRTLILVPKPA